MEENMQNMVHELSDAINAFYQKYADLGDIITIKRPIAEEWTLKEIIGHLINSASNYHQRLVGLQCVNEMNFFEYQNKVPDGWRRKGSMIIPCQI
jgi:hypothetical protein